MLGNSPQGQIVNHLLQQRRTMPNAAQPQARQQQAATATPGAAPVASVRRGGLVPHRDAGGGMGVSSSMADPWWTRQQASQDSRGGGFLQGSTPGRADALHTSAPAGAYILPADVVAGLGEGNSLAGARVWDTILRTGPHGIQQSPEHGGRGPPQAPRPAAMAGQAKGGGVHGDGSGKPTPVALSHGEIIVMPEDVKRFSQWFGGNGDLKHGHRILDAFVVYERRRQIKKLKSLPGPVGARKTA